MAEELVVFEKATAQELIRLLPGAGGVTPGPDSRRFPNFIMLGRTGVGGLSTTSESNVKLYKPTALGWELTEEIQPARAWPVFVQEERDVFLLPVDGRWVAMDPDKQDPSDTLERFVMTSNWFGGLATATFTNLSEPGWPVENGIVEDPLGIFTDILGVGGQGLSTRTRYGRHYVIQAKCDQFEVPPVDPVGRCQVYTESSGLQCFITTSAICNLLGGTYGGNGTNCS